MRSLADAAASEFKNLSVINVTGTGGAIGMLQGANSKTGLGNQISANFKNVYYDGTVSAITDLLGGHIDAVAVSYAEVSAFVESGDRKVLAVLADNCLESIPNIPTAKESGYDVVLGTWRGIAVPASTPDAVVAELYRIFSAAASEKFKPFMKNTNNVIEIMDGLSCHENMKNELELYSAIVKDLNLQ